MLTGAIASSDTPFQPPLCVAASILLKLSNPRVNLVQSILSLILKTGQATKLTFNRLQKLGLCMAHNTTISLMNDLAEGHDEEVHEWKDELVKTIAKPNNQEVEISLRMATQPSQLTRDYSSCPQSLRDSFFNVPEDTDFTDHTSVTDVLLTSSSSHSPPVSPLSLQDLASPALFSSPLSPNLSPISEELASSPSSPSFISYSPAIRDAHAGATVRCQLSTPLSSTIEQQVPCQVPSPSCQLHPTTSTPVQDSQLRQQDRGWHGFCIVGDNIDKNVKPRHQTLEHTTRSLHYFNSYAILDRIDLSGFSDIQPSVDMASFDFSLIYPSANDHRQLMAGFAVIVSRVLATHFSAFTEIAGITRDHISHIHSKEMSEKSKVVPLGILMKNENVAAEMVDILVSLHQYVPQVEVNSTMNVPGCSEPDNVKAQALHKVLLGGDQLTVVRARAAQLARDNAYDGAGRLEGFIPVCHDWHAKVCLLEVIWIRHFNKDSSREVGTLAQLKNLLNRSTVPIIPKKNVHATEDFLQVVMEGYLLSAALHYFGVQSTSDLPDPALVDRLKRMPPKNRAAAFECVAASIIQPYVNFSIPSPSENSSHDHTDGVLNYAKSLLSLVLLWAEFEDAIREGDGPRVMRCWKFLFLVFKSARRNNYAIEAFTLLALNQSFLSPRQREQLVWSRFVNYSGKPGANTAGDLHMEHINRTTKGALGNQRSNIIPRAVARAGQAAGPLVNITDQFDSMTALARASGKHTAVSHDKDLDKVVNALNESAQVFTSASGRKHCHFNTKASPLHSLNKANIDSWMHTRLRRLCF